MSLDLESFHLLGPWAWIIIGVFLCTAEMLAPGAFLIWLGLAAIATGLITMLAPLSAAWSVVVFATLGLVFAFFGYRVYGARRKDGAEAAPNQGAHAFIGREVMLSDPIEQGAGSIRLGDTVWRVLGPDLPAGRNVRVVGVERGVLLKVEAA